MPESNVQSPSLSVFQSSPYTYKVKDDAFPIVHVPEITPEKTVPSIVNGARKAMKRSDLHTFARALIRNAIDKRFDPALSKWTEALAVHDAVWNRTRYTDDPKDIELTYEAETTFQLWQMFGRWAEDCDGFTGMVLALLWSLGHHCSVTLLGFDKWVKGFDHVVIETKLPVLGWRIVDPSETHAIKMASEIAYFQRFEVEPVA